MKTILTIFLSLLAFSGMGQTLPSIAPSALFTDAEGNMDEGTQFSGSAPVEATFSAGLTDDAEWDAHVEWRFYLNTDTTAYLVRYERETSYTFRASGSHRVVVYVRFTQDGQAPIEYNNEDDPITVSISESRLEMPNAFSPNGEEPNKVYRAKPGYQSLVEFHAYIYNRWGQLLYDWTDPAGGWDGTHRGKPVPQGVYFVLVKAKGADGRVFNIKRDVNLLRGYTERTSR